MQSLHELFTFSYMRDVLILYGINAIFLLYRYLALYKGLVPKIMRLGPGNNDLYIDINHRLSVTDEKHCN